MTTLDRELIDDRYLLDGLIAHGGMADVYRAQDRLLLRQVAVKILREVSDPSQRERFVAEAQTLARLNHPGLVTLLDAGITGDQPYLVMELIGGAPLSQRIAEGALPPAEVRTIGIQVAEALAYAHAQGVVHRDVKPSNVLLDEDRSRLVDFGIAWLVGATDHHTRTGTAIGSPAYLAPEQVASEPITPAADVFSLGLVLLEALTGARAYTGSPIEAAVARLSAAPAIPASVDPGWRSLLARMTHRDPSDRPTATEVAAELAEAPIPAAAPIPVPADALEATGELAVTMETPLEAAGAAPVAAAAPAAAAAAVEPVAEERRRRHRAAAWAGAALLTLGLAAAGVAVLAQPGTDNTTDRSPAVVPKDGPRRAQPSADTTSTGRSGPSHDATPTKKPKATRPVTPKASQTPTQSSTQPAAPAPTSAAPSTPASTPTTSGEPASSPTDAPTAQSTPAAAATGPASPGLSG